MWIFAEAWDWISDPQVKRNIEMLREFCREAQHEKAAEIAKKLIKEGMTVRKISSITGLTAKQIRELQNGT